MLETLLLIVFLINNYFVIY